MQEKGDAMQAWRRGVYLVLYLRVRGGLDEMNLLPDTPCCKDFRKLFEDQSALFCVV